MEETKDLKQSKFKSIIDDLFKYPLSLLSHPLAGWEEFKGKIWVAIVYLVLMCIAVIVAEVATGFLIKPVKDNNFNILLTTSTVLFPVLIGTIANWCITALFDGKGTLKKIFLTICYSFFPFVWLSLIATFLSNFIVQNEVAYINFINIIAACLCGYMLFFGMKGIHDFGLFKNIIMLIFTIVAIAIIIFLTLLFLSFIQQIVQWILSIINEIKLRYF